MSFYNMIFGQNPDSDQILEALGLKKDDVARFRDCFIEDNGNIAIYTRLGGGNREGYPEEIEYLQSVNGYLYDEDDEYDCTYATFYYRLPINKEESANENCRTDTIPDIAELQRQNAVLKALFRKLFDEASWTVYDTIQNEAREAGVIIPHEVTQEDIDDVRFDSSECELGDTVYVMSDWMQNAAAKIPIPSRAEVAREFMETLITELSYYRDGSHVKARHCGEPILKEWEDAESKTNSI